MQGQMPVPMQGQMQNQMPVPGMEGAQPELQQKLGVRQQMPGGAVYSNFVGAEHYDMGSPERQMGSPGQWLETDMSGPEDHMVRLDTAGVAYWRTLSKAQKIQASIDWNQSRLSPGYGNIKEVGAFWMRKDNDELTLFDRNMWAPMQVYQHGQAQNQMLQLANQFVQGSPLRPAPRPQLQPMMPTQMQGAHPPQLQQEGYEDPSGGWGEQGDWSGWNGESRYPESVPKKGEKDGKSETGGKGADAKDGKEKGGKGDSAGPEAYPGQGDGGNYYQDDYGGGYQQGHGKKKQHQAVDEKGKSSGKGKKGKEPGKGKQGKQEKPESWKGWNEDQKMGQDWGADGVTVQEASAKEKEWRAVPTQKDDWGSAAPASASIEKDRPGKGEAARDWMGLKTLWLPGERLKRKRGVYVTDEKPWNNVPYASSIWGKALNLSDLDCQFEPEDNNYQRMIAENKPLLQNVGYADHHTGDVCYVDSGGTVRWSNGVVGYEPRLFKVSEEIMNQPWVRLGGVHWYKDEDDGSWQCEIGARRMKSGSVSYLPVKQWNGGLGPKSYPKSAKPKSRSRADGQPEEDQGAGWPEPEPAAPKEPGPESIHPLEFRDPFRDADSRGFIKRFPIHLHKLDNGRADLENKVGIKIGDGANGTKKPTAVRLLGTALPFGATGASRLRSILQDARVFGGETELTAIAACRGLEACSDDLKLKVGMLFREAASTGISISNKPEMIMLGEAVIEELVRVWKENEDRMKKMTNGGPPLEARWATWVKFSVNGFPFYVSPKWDDELGLATWVFEQQLAPLVHQSQESWQAVRQVWLEECGQQLNLPHTEEEAQEIAGSKQRWNDEVLAEIASEEAREILEWKDDEEDANPFEVLEDEADGDGEKQDDQNEKTSRPGRGRFPAVKDKVGAFAKTLAEKGKRSSGFQPVDEAARQEYYARQEEKGLRLLQALNEQQKKQIAVKWVQTAAKMIPGAAITGTQNGDKKAQTSAEKKIRENLVDKLISAIESHPAVGHVAPPLSGQELEDKLSETEFPTGDVPLEIRLDSLKLPGLPAPIPSLNVRMFIDEHGHFLGDEKTDEEWETQVRWLMLRQSEEHLTRDELGLCTDTKYKHVTGRREQFIRVQEQFVKQMKRQVTVYKILEWAVALDTGAPALVRKLQINTVLQEGISRANAERIFAEGWLHRLDKDKKPRSSPFRGTFPKESKNMKNILAIQMLEQDETEQGDYLDSPGPVA